MATDKTKSELEQVIADIKKGVQQTSINKVDEVIVMKTMLNDPNFYIGVYDRNNGYIGQRNPHNEAVGFVKDIIANTTGLDARDSQVLAEHYQFTKRNAQFLLTNMRDFLNVYTSSGRKINLIQNRETEASVYIKDIAESTRSVPDRDNSTRMTKTAAYKKLVSQSHCPSYSNYIENDN